MGTKKQSILPLPSILSDIYNEILARSAPCPEAMLFNRKMTCLNSGSYVSSLLFGTSGLRKAITRNGKLIEMRPETTDRLKGIYA